MWSRSARQAAGPGFFPSLRHRLLRPRLRSRKQEADAILAALKPPKRQRPLIAIVGINDATEVTDYLMPYGIIRRADVADVVLLATEPGPVKLFPALKVEPQATVAEFDAQHPDGADYVIVPAMSRDDDATVLKWLNSQAAKGAMTIGVCAGAKVVGEAGLLDGKRATTHWYYLEELLDKHPAIHYVADRRVVIDQRRRDDDGDHGVDADVTHPDRGHCRARTGRRRSAGISGWRTGTRVTPAMRSGSRARLR